jgi:hypothetical protein
MLVAFLRVRLAHFTAVWLSLHVMLMAAAPAAMLFVPPGNASLICTCLHGADHGACPMHRTDANADPSRCRLQSPAGDFAAVIVWTHALAAPMLGETDADFRYSAGPALHVSRVPADSSLPPDAPPPRA